MNFKSNIIEMIRVYMRCISDKLAETTSYFVWARTVSHYAMGN